MVKWVLLLMVIAVLPPEKLDFGELKEWYALNDGVMGGLSIGDVNYTKNTLQFTGQLSFKNNGGFASIRSPWDKYDLSSYKKVIIRYKATGVDFALTLETDQRWYNPYFKAPLQQTSDWKEIELDFNVFKAHQVGRALNYSPGKDILKNIIRLGAITNEKSDKPFLLEIDYILFK